MHIQVGSVPFQSGLSDYHAYCLSVGILAPATSDFLRQLKDQSVIVSPPMRDCHLMSAFVCTESTDTMTHDDFVCFDFIKGLFEWVLFVDTLSRKSVLKSKVNNLKFTFIFIRQSKSSL